MTTETPYTNEQIDRRFERVQLQLDNKMDRLLSGFALMETHVEAQLMGYGKDITWLKALILALFGLVFGLYFKH